MLKKILIGAVLVFLAIQFVPVEVESQEVNPNEDFLSVVEASEQTKELFRSACYDCHSYEVNHPWYNLVAPISWWTKHHINEAREYVNFSTLITLDEEERNWKLKEAMEEVSNGEMPLRSYTLMHPEAKLSSKQKKELLDLLKSFSTEE